MKKWIPLALVAFFALYLAGKVVPKRDRDFDWQQFGRIPVMANGRFQPIDSLARNALLQLREKASALTSTVHKGPDKGRPLPANQWIAEMMFKPDIADTRPVFRIDNLELKQTLGLPVEPDETKNVDGKHFSYGQFKGQIIPLQEQANQAAAAKAELRSPFQRAVLQLWGGVQVYWRLQNLVQPRIEDILAALRAKPPKDAEQFLQMVLSVPQRRALGLGPPMTGAEQDRWARDTVDLFLDGCRVRPVVKVRRKRVAAKERK